jgi:deoxyribodipyrimidine photolyase-related protein
MPQPKPITVWILGDQLLESHPALDEALRQQDKDHIVVLFIESLERIRQLPYQRKKLVLLLSAMRHYAQALIQQGYQVDYRRCDTFAQGLRDHQDTYPPQRIVMMLGAEFDMRVYQQSRLVDDLSIPVDLLPNTQFLVERFSPFPAPQPGKRTIMETFYREMRRHFHILMDDDGQPVGDKWNFDSDNRKPLRKGLTPPVLPLFPPDDITQDVMREVTGMDHGVGSADHFDLPVDHAQAEAAFQDFLKHRLPSFGDYEDAMSSTHAVLFHSQLSPLMNIGLLEPLHMIRAAEMEYRIGNAPLNAVEGFVRQILGWREFMYWRYWQHMPGLRDSNTWNAARPMPAMFWTAQTNMRCIQTVVQRLLDDGYNHHIERLMIICNFCLLAGIDPRQVSDWFLTFYVDAYDWVVLPNVIGMGLNADGGQIATKPYIASANYINRMSDYCKGCYFDPKKRSGARACPYNFLYWAFLIRHEQALRSNPRMGNNVLALRHISPEERQALVAEAEDFLAALAYYEG